MAENMSKLLSVTLSVIGIMFSVAGFSHKVLAQQGQGQGGGGNKTPKITGAKLVDADGVPIGAFIGMFKNTSVFSAKDENNQVIGDVVLTTSGGGQATTEVAEVEDQQPGAGVSGVVLIPGSDSEQYMAAVASCSHDDDKGCVQGTIALVVNPAITFESTDCSGPPFCSSSSQWGAPKVCMADSIGYAKGESLGAKTINSFKSEREEGVCFNAANPPPQGFPAGGLPIDAFSAVQVFDLNLNPRPWRVAY
jgi:hypothetical protein